MIALRERERMGNLVSEMSPSEEREGFRFACDIDDVLADSWPDHVHHLNQHFGTNLTPEQVARYGYVQDVPGWRRFGDEFTNFMRLTRLDPDFAMSHSVIEGALEGVWALSEIGTFVAYITTRPESLHQATVDGLRINGFPQAPVICMPDRFLLTSQELDWKRQQVEELGVHLLIEDNVSLAEQLGGVSVIIINGIHNRNFPAQGEHIIRALCWAEVPPVAVSLRERLTTQDSVIAKVWAFA